MQNYICRIFAVSSSLMEIERAPLKLKLLNFMACIGGEFPNFAARTRGKLSWRIIERRTKNVLIRNLKNPKNLILKYIKHAWIFLND
jgi:hypothetical protein